MSRMVHSDKQGILKISTILNVVLFHCHTLYVSNILRNLKCDTPNTVLIACILVLLVSKIKRNNDMNDQTHFKT